MKSRDLLVGAAVVAAGALGLALWGMKRIHQALNLPFVGDRLDWRKFNVKANPSIPGYFSVEHLSEEAEAKGAGNAEAWKNGELAKGNWIFYQNDVLFSEKAGRFPERLLENSKNLGQLSDWSIAARGKS